jgi:PAS domain S-box-containing protein
MGDNDKRSILVVDDEPLVNQTVAGILAKHGYATTSAMSAQQCLDIIRQPNPPELVLMDIDLGEGMDGVAAAQVIIRESSIPVLFLSGHVEPAFVSRTEDVSSYGFVFKDAGETILLASVKMAFRLYDARKAADEREAALQASEARFRSLFDEAPVGYHELNLEGEVVNVNETELRMLGYERSEVLGQKIWKLVVEPESHGAVSAKLSGRLQPGKRYERTFRRKDGSTITVMVDDVLLKDSTGKATGIRSTIQDVTRNREADQRLHESEERYRILIENATETIAVVQNSLIKFANAPAEQLTGYSRRELLGKPFADLLLHEDRERALLNQQQRIDGSLPATNVEKIRIKRRDGSIRWVEIRATVISWGGSSATLDFLVDFTERKEAEDALAKALSEKSAILSELQQRIKSSLSMISALIGLETGRVDNPSAVAALGVLRDRVNSLSRMYLLMDQSGEFGHIRIDGYFTQLVRALVDKYIPGQTRVKVREHYDSLQTDAKVAAPCGIILNELLTNALWHAFPNGRSGNVDIALRGNDRELTITVTDDGTGPPAEFNPQKTQGVGLHIVELLAEQLHGRVTFARTDRTTFAVTIPRD